MNNSDFFKGSAKEWRNEKVCFFCGTKENLQRSHLFPRRLTNEFASSNDKQMVYLPMCKDCHKKYDWIMKKIIEPIVLNLKQTYEVTKIDWIGKTVTSMLFWRDDINNQINRSVRQIVDDDIPDMPKINRTHISTLFAKLQKLEARIDLVEGT